MRPLPPFFYYQRFSLFGSHTINQPVDAAMLHSMSFDNAYANFCCCFYIFFPGCEQFFLSLKTPLLLFACCIPPPSFLYSYFLESPLFCFYCLFSSFLFTIFLIAWFGLKASLYYQPFSVISVVSVVSVHYLSLITPLAFSRTRMISFEHVRNERVGLSPTITQKICLVLVLVPFYPLSSTLYPLSPACF